MRAAVANPAILTSVLFRVYVLACMEKASSRSSAHAAACQDGDGDGVSESSTFEHNLNGGQNGDIPFPPHAARYSYPGHG